MVNKKAEMAHQLMMREAQDMRNNGCQSVLGDRPYDGIWYKTVGKWLHYMEKTYQECQHEVDLSYHILGLRHALIQKGLQRREKYHTTRPAHRHRPNGRVLLGG